jgi:hypothetical protein
MALRRSSVGSGHDQTGRNGGSGHIDSLADELEIASAKQAVSQPKTRLRVRSGSSGQFEDDQP